MPLSPEQNATLQLLLERGQSYRDLAGLLKVDESEVRARARAALEQLGGTDPDRDVALTDYLLGQADPISRADVVRHLRDNPDDHRLAGELADVLRTTYPNAELPRLPGEPRPQRRPRRTGRASVGQRLDLSEKQTRLMVGLGAATILMLAVVLAVTGAFSGDESSSGSTTAAEGEAPADERAVPVVLRAVGDSDARGAVVFGFATADQPFIEYQIRDLDPPSADDAYILWFLRDDDQGFPVPIPLEVDDQGRVLDRVAVPAETIAVALDASSIAVALNDREQLNRAIDRALAGNQQVLEFRGRQVLRAELRRGGENAAGG